MGAKEKLKTFSKLNYLYGRKWVTSPYLKIIEIITRSLSLKYTSAVILGFQSCLILQLWWCINLSHKVVDVLLKKTKKNIKSFKTCGYFSRGQNETFKWGMSHGYKRKAVKMYIFLSREIEIKGKFMKI